MSNCHHCKDDDNVSNHQQCSEPNPPTYWGVESCRPAPIRPRDNLQCAGGNDSELQTEYRASYKGHCCYHPTKRGHCNNNQFDASNHNIVQEPMAENQCQSETQKLHENAGFESTADWQSNSKNENNNNCSYIDGNDILEVVDESENNKLKKDTICMDKPFEDNNMCPIVSPGRKAPIPANNNLVCTLDESRLYLKANRLCNGMNVSPYGCACGPSGMRFPENSRVGQRFACDTLADSQAHSDKNRLCFMPSSPESRNKCVCMNPQMEHTQLCYGSKLNVGPDYDYNEERFRRQNNICN